MLMQVAHATESGLIPAPSSWLLLSRDLIVPGARALDVACGNGRHALWLAASGCSVRAVDRDPEKLDSLRATATRLGLAVATDVVDLEADGLDLGTHDYDLIVVVHYLHRPLFPVLARALVPGGILLYETFTVDQAARGRPMQPAHLLRHGELPTLVAPLEVLRERDGEFEERMVAAVAARKPRD